MSTDSYRPSPDELLARVRAEEEQSKRGKLSIFLGYAAGVGKTYAMLEAARARLADGVEAVVAVVETHNRVEIEVLLQGLELIPRRRIHYRGVPLAEMDVDAVLARHPQLAVVDELAHTNAPGSRHPKRYQDVEELLSAGIDVYTTLNVQHLESLNDVVAQITGVIVRETVPDHVLEVASEIDLIDLSPEELLQRLKEGKVYVPEQAARAIDRFFRKGNLTALREIALRRTAARVDDQMRAYMESRAIPGPWPAAERLLVCVSPGALSDRLVRTGRRLADELKAEWFAAYVETPESTHLSPTERARIAQRLHLAEELGAQVLTLPGRDVAETIVDYAHSQNVTKIIAGKHVRTRWTEMWRGSIVDRLLQASGNIDVYVISSEAPPERPARSLSWRPHRPWRRYVLALALVTAITLLGLPISGNIAPTNMVMFYLVAVVVAAVYLGRGPSVLAAILGVLALDYFFVPPALTFAVSDTQYLLTFIGLLIVGLVISALTARVREHAESAHRREIEAVELYEFSRDLAISFGLDQILQATITHVGKTFWRDVAVLLPERGTLKPRAQSPGLILDDNQMAVAHWCFQHGEPAGQSTGTLPAATIRCLPLKTARGVVGVLAIKPPDSTALLPPAQRRLLESFASQAALAVERTELADQARKAQVLEAAEQLETALLNSISHDLRTPLVSITGTLSSLAEDAARLDLTTAHNMIETAYGEAQRLNRLVGNLLEMTRIEAGAIRVLRESCDVQDLIGATLGQLSDRLDGRQVSVDLPTLPLVPMDFALMVQVLVNLIENAVKYSPPGTPIDIGARTAGRCLEIHVADRGIGIPKDDLTRVFDKFYRVQRPDGVAGTGLGLSICKGIVEAHGGQIRADHRPGGGSVFTVSLPLQEEEPNAASTEAAVAEETRVEAVSRGER